MRRYWASKRSDSCKILPSLCSYLYRSLWFFTPISSPRQITPNTGPVIFPGDKETCYWSASALASLFRGVIQSLVSVGSCSFQGLFLQCQLVLWPQWVALVGERFVKGLEESGGASTQTWGGEPIPYALLWFYSLVGWNQCAMPHSKLCSLEPCCPAVALGLTLLFLCVLLLCA